MPRISEEHACSRCISVFATAAELEDHKRRMHAAEDIGRNLLGSESLEDAEVRLSAKYSKQQLENGEDLSKEEAAEKRKARKLALEKIGGVICRKAASMPYYLWAGMAGNPDYKLTRAEMEELADAYLEVCKGYNADFTSPVFGVIAAIAINGEIVAKRLGFDTNPDRMIQQ